MFWFSTICWAMFNVQQMPRRSMNPSFFFLTTMWLMKGVVHILHAWPSSLINWNINILTLFFIQHQHIQNTLKTERNKKKRKKNQNEPHSDERKKRKSTTFINISNCFCIHKPNSRSTSILIISITSVNVIKMKCQSVVVFAWNVYFNCIYVQCLMFVVLQ